MSDFKVMNDDEIRDFCIKKDLKIYELEKKLQQKENIIKEVREYLTNNAIFDINDKGVNKTMLSMLRGSDKE